MSEGRSLPVPLTVQDSRFGTRPRDYRLGFDVEDGQIPYDAIGCVMDSGFLPRAGSLVTASVVAFPFTRELSGFEIEQR